MKRELRKLSIVQVLLWVALLLALLGSLRHVAYIFTSIDQATSWGWLQAVAVDAGLFALALGITQRRRAKRPTRWLWCGVVLFSGISIYANLAYGLTFTLDSVPHWVDVSRPWVLAATLPLLVLYLAEVVGTDVNYLAQQAEREQRKEEREQQRTPAPPIVQARIVKAEQDSAAQLARRRQLVDILNTEPGLGATELARRVNSSRTTIYKDLDTLRNEGTIGRNGR